MSHGALRPNYRRAREIQAQRNQLAIDIETAEREGRSEEADLLMEDMDALDHEFFLTGAQEYDL